MICIQMFNFHWWGSCCRVIPAPISLVSGNDTAALTLAICVAYNQRRRALFSHTVRQHWGCNNVSCGLYRAYLDIVSLLMCTFVWVIFVIVQTMEWAVDEAAISGLQHSYMYVQYMCVWRCSCCSRFLGIPLWILLQMSSFLTLNCLMLFRVLN